MMEWMTKSWRPAGLSVERSAAPRTGNEHGWYLQLVAEAEVLS